MLFRYFLSNRSTWCALCVVFFALSLPVGWFAIRNDACKLNPKKKTHIFYHPKAMTNFKMPIIVIKLQRVDDDESGINPLLISDTIRRRSEVEQIPVRYQLKIDVQAQNQKTRHQATKNPTSISQITTGILLPRTPYKPW